MAEISEYTSLEQKKKNWKSELSFVFHEAYGGLWLQAEEDFHWWIEELVEKQLKEIQFKPSVQQEKNY